MKNEVRPELNLVRKHIREYTKKNGSGPTRMHVDPVFFRKVYGQVPTSSRLVFDRALSRAHINHILLGDCIIAENQHVPVGEIWATGKRESDGVDI